MTRLASGLVGLSLLVAPAGAQRDAAPVAIVGTSVLSGTLVTDAVDPQPVRRAVMSLTVADGRVPRMTVTDDSGRFVFADLPAGLFTLSASKPGFVTAYHGGKRPGRGPGSPVVIADGAKVAVSMTMLRGAVIGGVIRDPQGRPAAGAGFQLMQYRVTGGEKTLVGAYGGYGYTFTDDRGMYRAFGLPPGDYFVVVTGRAFGASPLREVTSADLLWAEQQFTNSAPRPAPSPEAAAVDASTPPVSLSPPVLNAPVYYPGTTDLAQAVAITVRPGEERADVDFAIRYVRTARIEGTVVDAEGRPANGAQVNLVATSQQPGDFVMAMSSASRVSVASGRFALSGIAPGQYTITVRGGGAGPNGGPPTAGGAVAASWALQEVTVDGHDLSGIAMTLQPGLVVSGRVAFEGASTPPDVTKARLSLSSIQTTSGLSFNSPAVSVNADGTFAWSGLPPGRYRIGAVPVAGAAGVSWTMRGAVTGGRDVADLFLELKPAARVSDIVVTFVDRAAEVNGTVLDRSGRPTPDYSIVVFTTDRAQWLSGSRRVKATRLSNTGSFSVTGLPAGEYFVCAATDYDASDLSDPAFLGQLAAQAFRVTLAEGEKRTQDLKIAGGG